jgi:hypothetical protein
VLGQSSRIRRFQAAFADLPSARFDLPESIRLGSPLIHMFVRPVAQTLVTLLMAALAFAAGDPAILAIRIAEGDDAVYATGSRATRGLTVLITDEAGRPVDGATVSFVLPASGPSGIFSSGSRTEIATTHSDGRAAVWGMRWNRSAGPFEIRITAVKGEARAGTVSAQALSDLPVAKGAAPTKSGAGRGGHKLLWISVILAGAAAAGTAGVVAGKTTTGAAAIPATALQIGTPTITLSHP